MHHHEAGAAGEFILPLGGNIHIEFFTRDVGDRQLERLDNFAVVSVVDFLLSRCSLKALEGIGLQLFGVTSTRGIVVYSQVPNLLSGPLLDIVN